LAAPDLSAAGVFGVAALMAGGLAVAFTGRRGNSARRRSGTNAEKAASSSGAAAG
jgi:hypothetical protein